MADDPKAQFIRPPNTLQEKVGPPSPGGIDAAALDRAEQVIQEMSGAYLEWVRGDLDKIQAALETLRKSSEEEAKKALERIFDIAHDMKGQGGSFDYPLITQVGNQLCRFIETVDQPDDNAVKVIHLHIDAMRLIIANRLVGDGGAHGQRLVRGLEAILVKLSD